MKQPISEHKNGSRKHKILHELKSRLLDKAPEAGVEKVILFGSQATGKARKDSDVDILVVLRNDYDWRLRRKIIDECYEIDLGYNVVTDIKMISERELGTLRGQQPLIVDAIRGGLAV